MRPSTRTQPCRPRCLNEGLPQKGKQSRVVAAVVAVELGASMKGFPRRGSNSGLEKSLLVK